MASKKKKSRKTGPRPTVRRGPFPSAASPGELTPSPAPSYRDQTKKTQQAIEQRVGNAGREAYGYPVRMKDAVDARVRLIEDAVRRSPNGVPAGLDWYEQHQNDLAEVTQEVNQTGTSPVSLGRMINASAPLSIQNKPHIEVRATRSAGYIAAHPEEEVHVPADLSKKTIELSTDKKGKVNENLIVPETPPNKPYKLRNLSPDQIAMLGHAETKIVEETGGERNLKRAITSVKLDSAGRGPASQAIALTRGANFDAVVKDGPKIRNYATRTHLATPAETAYNKEVFWRRSNDPVFKEGDTTWHQGHLLSASQMSGYIPDPSTDITVEDYIGIDVSARTAMRKSPLDKEHGKAQDELNVTKGKAGTLPADMSADQALHAFNEEATRRAAEVFSHTSRTNDGDVTETPTAGGAAQPVFWVEEQTQKNPPKPPKEKRQPKQPKPPTLFKI